MRVSVGAFKTFLCLYLTFKADGSAFDSSYTMSSLRRDRRGYKHETSLSSCVCAGAELLRSGTSVISSAVTQASSPVGMTARFLLSVPRRVQTSAHSDLASVSSSHRHHLGVTTLHNDLRPPALQPAWHCLRTWRTRRRFISVQQLRSSRAR